MISRHLQTADFFVVRLPRNPVEPAKDLPQSTPELWRFLLQWSQRPDIRLALYVASPSLIERLDTLKANDHKQQQKLLMSLLKYFIRSSYRPTPFGLFAGIHTGRAGTITSLAAEKPDKDRKNSRLDMFYLTEVREQLTRPSAIAPQHLVFANPTLWLRDQHFHYIDSYQNKDQRQFRLSAVRFQPYLAKLLEWSAQPINIASLSQLFLQSYTDCAIEVLHNYLQQLVNERVLLVHLPLVISNGNPDTPFCQALTTFGAGSAAAVIGTALSQLQAFDEARLADIAQLRQVSTTLRQLPYPVNEAKLVQTDCWRAMQTCSLDSQLGQRLMPVLLSLLHVSKQRKSTLEEFARAFTERYETARVPLLAVLDDESGISFSTETGFDSPLLAGIPLRKTATKLSAADNNPFVRQLDAASQASHLQFSSKELLADADLPKLERQLPTSFAIKFALFGESAAPLIHYQGCNGPSAANMLGRFCHLDPTLESAVRDHLSAEQAITPDVLLAEVVHLPDGRPGNVIARPALRPFEIVLLADSGVDKEHQISLQELSVYVERGKVCLWSERLQRRIVPRMSNAHNFSQRSLGLYRFLLSIMYQDVRLPQFTWPDEILKTQHLPRVSIDDCVVSCARWRITRTELVSLKEQLLEDCSYWSIFSRRYQLPETLCYAAGDNVLTLNLGQVNQLELLLEETAGQEYVVLEEALITQFASAIAGPEGHYAHEILWPVLNTAAATSLSTPLQTGLWSTIATPRQYAPGSEWLSCKIYCGQSSAEILLQLLAPAIACWQQQGWCTQWFFIRYSDPNWHIRLRFQGEPDILLSRLYPALYQLCLPLLQSGRIHNLQLMTYVRETERYGGEHAIQLAEHWFCHESSFLLRVLPAVIAQGEVSRFHLALAMVDAQLSAFGFNNAQKLQWVSDIRQAFANEMQETKFVRQRLGEKYRQYIAKLRPNEELRHNVLVDYQPKQQEIGASYLQLAQANRLAQPLATIIGAFSHMLTNRIFKAYGREHEYLVYDMLRRHYLAKIQQASPGQLNDQ